MVADPEPDKYIAVPDRERTIGVSNPYRPEMSYRFEMQGRVKGIFSEGPLPYGRGSLTHCERLFRPATVRERLNVMREFTTDCRGGVESLLPSHGSYLRRFPEETLQSISSRLRRAKWP